LRTVDEVIAVGGGHDKIAAFRAVLRGGYTTSLITDAIVARALLDQPPSLAMHVQQNEKERG
jgi:DNA-binding transcriptional regulator LsrR (DeoR family)